MKLFRCTFLELWPKEYYQRIADTSNQPTAIELDCVQSSPVLLTEQEIAAYRNSGLTVEAHL